MPDQFERHSKSRWEWGSPSSRSQQRQAAANDDPLHEKTPSKKDPNACKGNKGGPHVVVLVKLDGRYYGGDKATCGWGSRWNSRQNAFIPGYYCYHAERCSGCGKRYRWKLDAEECPDYRAEIPRYIEDKCAEDNARREARDSKWRRWRKPVITGPTHYRRKRVDKMEDDGIQ